MNIAVIPARGGSKRIPRKNVRDFMGKPMIAWSIEAARRSGLFEHVLVSTDDEEIASVGRSLGAETPFIRPAELSDDHTATTAVVAHATQWTIDQGWAVTAVCCLYPTAPLVRAVDLKRGLTLLESGPWSYAFAATGFAAPIFRSFRAHDDGSIEMFFPEHFETRSQDLPRALHDAGQFYWGRPAAWLSAARLFDRHSTVVLMEPWRVQDIDTEEDWQRAELVAEIISRRESVE